MNNTFLADNSAVYYALKVNGQIISRPVLSPSVLETQKQSLPLNEQASAMIVMVTASGSELLLG